MRRLNCCLTFQFTLICFIVFLLSVSLFNFTAYALTASYGQPYHGRLVNGIPFPSQFRGYQLREEDRTYTTPEVAGALLDAIESVRTQHPNTCDLYLGDFSRTGGGPANHHRSHQNGRDVDIGMYAKGNRILNTLVPMNEENLDVIKTWCLIEGLLRSQRVQYIFLDRRVQKLLYDYASSQGVDQGYLDRLFSNERGCIVQHVVNHVDHMHVRFFTPWSTLAAHIDENDDQKRTVIEMAQQSYLPKKVQYYARGTERGLEALAQSFGVTSKDLCRWNNMHGSEVLAPGSCVVFYKRGFEVEPVHLAQSLQPFSIPAPESHVQVASLRPARTTLSDAPVTLRDTPSVKEKKVEVPVVSTYTAHRGDTLDKVAKRNGMDVNALCEMNGMKKSSPLRTGQKIKLTSLKTISTVTAEKTATDTSKVSLGKSTQVLPATDPKKAKASVPAPYTVGKGDSLQKIAKQTGMSVEALCQINGIKKNGSLMPGQKLQLAQVEPVTKTSSSSSIPARETQARLQPQSKAAIPASPATAPRGSIKSASAKPAPAAKNTAPAAKSVPQAKAAPVSKSASPAKSTSTTKTAPAATVTSSKASAAASKTQTASKAAPAVKAVPASQAKTAPAQKSASAASGKPSKAPAASNEKASTSAKNLKQARR